MEEIIIQFVESFKGNFFEIVLAASFLWSCITGNRTEAQKKAKALARHTKARDKAIAKAEKENTKIHELKKDGETNANS